MQAFQYLLTKNPEFFVFHFDYGASTVSTGS